MTGLHPQPWDRWRDGAALAAVTVAAIAIQLPIYDRWISLLDEGAILQIADQINSGSLLYRDATHLAWPGVFYLTAGLFRLFGTDILVTRWLMVAAFTLLVGLVYGLARTVAGRGVALGVGLLAVSYRVWALPHWHMISYASLALLLITLSVTLLAADIRRPARWKTPLAGALAGLAIVFKQDSGGFAFIGAMLFLWLDAVHAGPAEASTSGRLRRVFPYAAAACAAPLLMVAMLAPTGVLPDMLRQTVYVPLIKGQLWGPDVAGSELVAPYLSFPPLWPPFSQAAVLRQDGFFSYFPSLPLDLYWGEIFRSRLFQQTALADVALRCTYLLPYAAILGLAGWLRWQRGRLFETASAAEVRALRLLIIFAASVLLAFNRPRDWVHLLVLYPPTLVLLAPVCEAIAGPGAGWRRRVVLGMGAVITAIVAIGSFSLSLAARSFYDTPMPASARASIRVQSDTARALAPLLAALETPAHEPPAPLAALPYYPMLNFLSERPLATRFITVLPLQKFPDRDEQVLAGLDRDPRTDVVYGLQHLTGMPKPQAYAPRLFAGLIERYRLGAIFDESPSGMLFALLERRGARVDDVLLYDFAARLGAARLEIVSEEGAVSAPESGRAPALEMWPFEAPVMTFPATPGPGHSRLRFELDVPVDARLRFGAAMNPDEWRHFLPAELRFRVRIDGRVVFDESLDSRADLSDRRWLLADLPIAAGVGGAPVAVDFELSTNNGYGRIPGLGGWSSPRLVRADRLPGTREAAPTPR